MKSRLVRLLSLCAALALAWPLAAPAQDGRSALQKLFDEEWEFRLREDPLFATSTGDHRYDARLPAVSLADEKRRTDFRRSLLLRARAIERTRLSESDRVSLAMFEWELADAVEGFEHDRHLIPLTSDSGFHTELARLPDDVPLATTRDYENYTSRLRAMPQYVGQWIVLLRQAVKQGHTLPRVVLEGYERGIAAHVVDTPAKSKFFGPFQSFPAGVPAADRDRLRSAGEAAVRDGAVPAYRAFLDFMTREYIPAARATTGATDLPRGAALYRHLIRHFTTVDLTPDRVHEIGLSEVRRIRSEMDGVMRQAGFTGDFAAFLKFLRTDPRFYPKSAEELLKTASWIAKRMDGKLPSLFGRLPRQPYGVEPVPDDIAPKYTAGRYVGAPLDSPKAGRYWVNTYALASRPFYALEALSLHEAVPGHHLQVALAKELSDLPHFRRYAYVDAFGEGWGLYSERLGIEAGFYADPYSNFGRLTYEMWRACRLVVDTGLHAKGWTRQQAIDFMASNTALSLHEVATETDRYISWPGQALAYKMGELKIRELRKRAEEALGARFDVRAFHDALLANGTVTLPVMEERVDAFIRSRRGAP